MNLCQTITNRTLEKTFVTHQYVYFDDVFSKDELEKIIELNSKISLKDGDVSASDFDAIRVSKITHQNPNKNNQWIFDRLNQFIMQVNLDIFNYDLTGYEFYQYAEYDEKNAGHYEYHVDIMFNGLNLNFGVNNIETRKLSMTLLLNEPEIDFEGGEFYVKLGADDENRVEFKAGRIILFPSYILHKVTPVTKGIRKSLVVWVTGPKFR